MRKTLALVFGTCVIAVSAMTWAGAQQPTSAAPTAAEIDKALQTFRADLQADRADLVGKNITLSADQAAKFWPQFAEYQKEQNVIMDEHHKGLQRYIDNYDKLDDAGALALMQANFDRDERMNTLRKKWLGEFQKLVGTKIAVRVMQIDRQLSNAYQLAIAVKLPLVR